MSFYILANDIISALAKTKIPVYHQFGEELLARRNDCFITVGITEFVSDEEKSEAKAKLSLYVPSDFSGGKILSLAAKIPEALTKSAPGVKSIKATDLCYDRKLDRLRYDFELKTDYDIPIKCREKISVLKTDIEVISFSFSRKQAVNEIQTVASGVITKSGGSFPLVLNVSGRISLDAESFCNLDSAVITGEALPIRLCEAVFPDMILKNYTVKGISDRSAVIKAEFMATTSEEGIKNE
ncbi:MAG: hypothetical protein ACI4KD_02820 [Oscillospiraceae bacterium]